MCTLLPTQKQHLVLLTSASSFTQFRECHPKMTSRNHDYKLMYDRLGQSGNFSDVSPVVGRDDGSLPAMALNITLLF